MSYRIACVVMSVALLFQSAVARERYQRPAAVAFDRGAEKWAEKTLRKLTLEEKVGQLFNIWVEVRFMNVNNPDYLQLRDSIRQFHIGSLTMTVDEDGPFLYRNQPYEAAMLLNRLQQDSRLPLLISADFERGVSMRLNGTTAFPAAMAFGAAGKAEYAEGFGRITAQEARAIGVQWNFFPVADVNSNPANPIINTRSFGEDPQAVSDLVTAYIHGARANGMLTTVKHFPGHGDTATDSHLGVAQVTGDRTRLNSVELPSFRKAIDAGVDAVMVAHVTVPALETDPNRVATTSPAIVSGLLKQELGFKGIVVTDALDMAGLTLLYKANIGQAAVDAFKAGNDLLIIPADLPASYRAVLEAARSGEIPTAQIDASVLKLLKAKASVGLHKARLVDISQLDTTVGKPENIAFGQKVADDAVTLVRDNGKLLPLKSPGTSATGLPYQTLEEIHNRLVMIVLVDDLRTGAGRAFEQELRARVPDANVIYLDPRIGGFGSAGVLNAVDQARGVIVAVYVSPTAGKMLRGAGGGITNSVGVPEPTGKLLQQVLDHAAERTAVVAMGNPYVAQDFPAIQNYICTFSTERVSAVSAVKALFGEIAIHGHLPVSIANIAPRGTGIERQAATSGGIHDGQKDLSQR